MRIRSKRHLPPKERIKSYLRRAVNSTSTFCLFFLISIALDFYGASAQSFDVSTAVQNKPMNFPYTNNITDYRNFETGEELDTTHPEYDERRWAFDWDVDMILRFKKGYAYCTSYVIVPAENTWPVAFRGFLYLITLFYLFLGVAIIADIFMAGIEQITAEREKVVLAKGDDNEPAERVIMYTAWNETVANLTLLALGSSAPEILLSLMETIQTLDQQPGELGPSTIVGSAAFNLLCITAVCTWSLEPVKKVKEFGVFLITSGASIFAYVWILIVLQLNTPDVVELWEAIITFLFFPLLVIVAWAQDRNWFREEKSDDPKKKILDAHFVDCTPDEVVEIVRKKKRESGARPSIADLEEEALKSHRPKLNHGHYRINALRNLIAKGSVIKMFEKSVAERGSRVSPSDHQRNRLDIPECGLVEFTSPSFSVLECEPEVALKLRRHHGFTGSVSVTYETQDLTAVSGTHYHSASGTITWEDGDTTEKEIRVRIIDNDYRNADMLFTCKLEAVPKSALGDIKAAVVTIIDDDLPGCLQFAHPVVEVSENAGTVKIEVVRENGSTGSLLVAYQTLDGLGPHGAKAPDDYQQTSGQLHFDPGETSKCIEVPIVDDTEYEKTEHFFVELLGVEGKAGGKLGHITRCRVDIRNDGKMTKLVDDILDRIKKDTDVNGKLKTESWCKQFKAAMVVEGAEGEEPGGMEYVMHFFTFFWKVLFAFVPPTELWGGWACFVVALIFIGLVTAMVAEVASLLGCVVGLKDSVTAITFVALGTSLPDTFASKQAAEQEEFADAAIGNVTGSNSVNVFLGLGLPWVVAAAYYESKGECYIVPSGALGFSVLIFTICALICLGILMLMRVTQGGELGGPSRKILAIFFCLLWFLYVLLSSLQAYDHFSFPGTDKKCPCDCKNRGVLPWAMLPADQVGSCIREKCPVV
eukprot:Sspe_Gene.15792::Locus_5504_Transcript_1_1_Confidence_1.000_Length_2984::g.15792::m.15792/K05849/SLC8A, NCX; solute carrier family 8 (sodium/calcium exchanger)